MLYNIVLVSAIYQHTITKMGKEGTVVTTDVLVKICVALNCEIGDIVEIVPDENA